MSWIQENKFTAALAGVTVVGSAALLYFAIQKSGDAEDFRSQAKKMATTELKLKQGVPFPDMENMELKQENVRDFHDMAQALQDQLVAYRPGDLTDFSSSQFGEHLNKFKSTLDAAFEEGEAKVPQGTYYGFEDYSSRQPAESATGELKYELDAFQWMLGELAKTGDVELLKVLRSPIAAEKSEAHNANHGRGKNAKKDDSVYQGQGLELSFRGSEAQLQQFLQAVANSKQYFFAIRSIRVINEKTTGPNRSDVKFEAPAPQADGFGAFGGDATGGFAFGGDAAADGGEAATGEDTAADATGEAAADDAAVEIPAQPVADPASDDTRILKPILGDEKVNAYLQMELLIFKPKGGKDGVTIPGKGNKTGGSAAETESAESETEK